MTTRQTIKTLTGFRTYGIFSAVLDTDQHGNITYSNLNSEAPEYKRMQNNSAKFRTQYYMTHPSK